jgi:hypothetical protein
MTDKLPDPLPAGYDVTNVTIDEAGAFATVWADGTVSGLTNSIEQAIVVHQRARFMALNTFLKRKRRPWPRPRI